MHDESRWPGIWQLIVSRPLEHLQTRKILFRNILMGTQCADNLSPCPVSPKHITSVSWPVSSLSLLSRDRWGHNVLIVCPRIQCLQNILQVLAGLFWVVPVVPGQMGTRCVDSLSPCPVYPNILQVLAGLFWVCPCCPGVAGISPLPQGFAPPGEIPSDLALPGARFLAPLFRDLTPPKV